MPPVRTLPAAKPVKTERTHEENQERAYIAASRRSDRSLEARIESARRASEIHKKRTGRALRVTEQDVINEEMYEEEDDDLPAQYRRLTAHLRTNSMDFNRRLQAYVATQIATRGALAEQGGQGHFASQYPNAPHFAHYGMPQSASTPMLAPQMFHRQPQQFRHSPYHVPPPGSTPQPRQRSASELQTNYSVDANISDDRRASMPVQALRSPSLQNPTNQASPLQAQSPSHPLSPTMEQMRQQQQPMFPDASYRYPVDNTDPSVFDYSNPLSMALPNDTQQLLYGSPLGFNGSFSNLVGGTQFPGGFNGYSYNPNPASKMQRVQSASEGPATTLAPAHALEAGFEATTDLSNSSSAIGDGASASFSPGFIPFYDSGDQFHGHAMKKESSNLGSGTLTPSGEFFNSFISGYEEGNQV